MRTKFKAWAEPFLNEHPEVQLEKIEGVYPFDDVYLEIGSGKGEFLLNMAKAHPEMFFIGVEKNVTCSGFTAKKLVENKIENAKLVWDDAQRFSTHLKDKSVHIIFLNFSDPWPKKRHTKRRLTSETFLDEYRRILKDDGTIIFKTDNRELFDYSLESFENAGFKIVSKTYEYLGDDTFDSVTEYEEWFRNENVPINRVVISK